VAIAGWTDFHPSSASLPPGDMCQGNRRAPSINKSSPDFSPIVDQTQIANLPSTADVGQNLLCSLRVVETIRAVSDLSAFADHTLLNNNTVDAHDQQPGLLLRRKTRTTQRRILPRQGSRRRVQVQTTSNILPVRPAPLAPSSTRHQEAAGNGFAVEGYLYDDGQWQGRNQSLYDTYHQRQVAPSPATPTSYRVRKIYGFGAGGRIIKGQALWYLAL